MYRFRLINDKSKYLYILFVFLMITVIVNKKNLHIDEVLTYGLANDTQGWMFPENERVYSPAVSAWLEYVTVGDNRFDYHAVWNNQAEDVHPPLYYALVHTICSLFAGKFSVWYAGAVNIFFAVLTLWTVRRLIKELTQSPQAVTWGTLVFVLSAGILSGVSFFRMYIMAMFEVTLVTWLFLQAVTKGCSWKIFIAVIGTSVMGALTHYYFIVYLFFLCVLFGIYLLIHKKYRDAMLFVSSMAVSGGISVWIFPSMIDHMFLEEASRGQESFDNLKNASLSGYLERLKIFYAFINKQLFGGFLTFIIMCILLFAIFNMVCRRKKIWERQRVALWLLMLFPSVCYYLLVAKMAVMMESRYILPIYAVVLSGVFSLLYDILQKILCGKRFRFAVGLLVFGIAVSGLKICNWEYLYSDSLEFLEKAQQYQNENAIYIYDMEWKLPCSFFEAANYKSVVFFSADEMKGLDEVPFKYDDSLIVSISDLCDSGEILNDILRIFPLLNNYEVIGGYGYTTSYHLYS